MNYYRYFRCNKIVFFYSLNKFIKVIEKKNSSGGLFYSFESNAKLLHSKNDFNFQAKFSLFFNLNIIQFGKMLRKRNFLSYKNFDDKHF